MGQGVMIKPSGGDRRRREIEHAAGSAGRAINCNWLKAELA
jgi:hypothetical protein